MQTRDAERKSYISRAIVCTRFPFLLFHQPFHFQGFSRGLATRMLHRTFARYRSIFISNFTLLKVSSAISRSLNTLGGVVAVLHSRSRPCQPSRNRNHRVHAYSTPRGSHIASANFLMRLRAGLLMRAERNLTSEAPWCAFEFGHDASKRALAK